MESARKLPPLPTTQRVPKPLAEIDPELAAVKEVALERDLERLAKKFAKPQPVECKLDEAPKRPQNGWVA